MLEACILSRDCFIGPDELRGGIVDTSSLLDSFLVAADGSTTLLDPLVFYVFGRSSKCEMSFDDNLCSRKHCRLFWDQAGTWMIEDLGSRNGTWVNNQRINGKLAVIDDTDIQFGSQRYTLRLLPPGTDPAALSGSLDKFNPYETFEIDPGTITLDNKRSFIGHIPTKGLKETLSFFTLTKKTGVLTLNKQENKYIWIDTGVPRHAICNSIEGWNALEELLKEKGHFHFKELENFESSNNISGKSQEIIANLFDADTSDAQRFERIQDLKIAADQQRHLLQRLPTIPGYDLGVYYRGLSEISGDFYDVAQLENGHIMVVLGDVSGHGMQAALVATQALKTLRLLRRQTVDLIQLLNQLNDEVCEDLLPSQFITLFAAVLDPVSGRMRVALSGHHSALLIHSGSNNPIENVGETGIALGMAKGKRFTLALQETEVEIPIGSALIQCSDGILEAEDESGEPYGRERLEQCLRKRNRHQSMEELAESIAKSALTFSNNLNDDITILGIARLAAVKNTNSSPASQSNAQDETFDMDRTMPLHKVKRKPRHGSTDQPTTYISKGPHVDQSSLNQSDHSAKVTRGSPIDKIFGLTKVIKLIGTPGESHVYLGQHVNLQMDVAIKIIRQRTAQSRINFSEQFIKEARQAIQVHHPNVVPILDAGCDHSGYAYLVMEHIEGYDLQHMLEHNGPIACNAGLMVTAQCAEGLAAIHDRNMAHHDIKPSNIILDERGTPRLADLGMTRVNSVSSRSSQEHFRGHPIYVAPEVVSGHCKDHSAADVYSLAATMYHILSGRPPFNKSSIMDLIRARQHENPDSLFDLIDDIPLNFANLIHSCLHRDPKKRPPARKLAKACYKISMGTTKVASRKLLQSSEEVIIYKPKAHPNTIWIIAGSIVALILTLILVLLIFDIIALA